MSFGFGTTSSSSGQFWYSDESGITDTPRIREVRPRSRPEKSSYHYASQSYRHGQGHGPAYEDVNYNGHDSREHGNWQSASAARTYNVREVRPQATSYRRESKSTARDKHHSAESQSKRPQNIRTTERSHSYSESFSKDGEHTHASFHAESQPQYSQSYYYAHGMHEQSSHGATGGYRVRIVVPDGTERPVSPGSRTHANRPDSNCKSHNIRHAAPGDYEQSRSHEAQAHSPQHRDPFGGYRTRTAAPHGSGYFPSSETQANSSHPQESFCGASKAYRTRTATPDDGGCPSPRSIPKNDDFDGSLGSKPSDDDLYKALAVSPDASAAELKEAYRTQCLLNHPDRTKETDKAAATDRMARINRAYDVLKDEKQRRLYNETGRISDTGF